MDRGLRIIFAITALLLGCDMNKKQEKNEDYEVYVDEVITSFAKDMKAEYGLLCYGSGGRMPFDIEEISIKFAAYRRASIDEARALEIAVTEKFIRAINSHEKIRPFLREYPVNANRAEVAISFKRPDNKQYTDGSVAYVFQVRNRIYYNADSETSPTLISLMDEPYDEALKIVDENSKK